MADYHLTHNAAEIDPALTAAENAAQVNGIVKGAGDGTFTNQPVDNTPTNGSANLVTSGGVYNALQGIGGNTYHDIGDGNIVIN